MAVFLHVETVSEPYQYDDVVLTSDRVSERWQFLRRSYEFKWVVKNFKTKRSTTMKISEKGGGV